MNASQKQEKSARAVDDNAAAARPERKIAIVGDRIDSRDLFVAGREIIIGHGSDFYRLRLTAQNKLILTK
jgi:hemin uptake protein HemP